MKTNVNIYIYIYHLAELFIKMRCFRQKVVENNKTRILCSTLFSKYLAIYEIMRKNAVELDRPQMAI
jgi:hypothetical protein